MAGLSAEDFARVLSAQMAETVRNLAQVLGQQQGVGAQQASAAHAAPNGGARGNDWNVHKYFTRLEKLERGDQWREWHYQFSVAAKAYRKDLGGLLEIVEKENIQEVDSAKLEQALVTLGNNGEMTMDEYKSDLFSVLTLLTKGEANQVIRGVTDHNGYVAWKKLCDRFNPRTPASLTAAWREVIRPKKVKDLREAGKAIDVWEQSVARLRNEHNDGPTEGLKAALLLEMIPESVQLTVAQGLTSRSPSYQAMKEQIKLMAAVQLDYCTPKPMDIGETGERMGEDWGENTEDWGEDVGAVGARKGKGRGPMHGSCWTCGGAHYQSECPKGSGKGPLGKGKGEGPTKGKGKSKTRAPMFGSCWTCGGAHFAADCPKGEGASGKGTGKGKGKALREVDEWDEDRREEVSSVTECWNICGVDEQRRPKRWVRKAMRHTPSGHCLQKTAVKTPTQNMFEALREDADELYIYQVDADPDVMCENCAAGENCREKVGDCDYINWVSEENGCEVVGKGEIVVDSGAAESVCPWDWATAFPIKQIPENSKRDFRNASGGPMGHYGERRVRCGIEGLSSPVSMLFQVSDARNPLASVARITEQGNVVQFGPKDADNYIYNPKTNEKIQLRRKGRKFVVDVNFLASGSPFSGRA